MILSGAITIQIYHIVVIKMMSLGSNGWEEPQIYGQYETSSKQKEDGLPLVVPDLKWDV